MSDTSRLGNRSRVGTVSPVNPARPPARRNKPPTRTSRPDGARESGQHPDGDDGHKVDEYV